MIVVSISILTLVIGVVLPILVGIVTKKVESRKLKGALLILFSSISGLITTGISANGVFTSDAIVAAVVSYVIATAMYYGVWKPQGISDYVQENIGRKD